MLRLMFHSSALTILKKTKICLIISTLSSMSAMQIQRKAEENIGQTRKSSPQSRNLFITAAALSVSASRLLINGRASSSSLTIFWALKEKTDLLSTPVATTLRNTATTLFLRIQTAATSISARVRKILLLLKEQQFLFKTLQSFRLQFVTQKRFKWQLSNSAKAEAFTSAAFLTALKTAVYFTGRFFGAQILKTSFTSGIQQTTMLRFTLMLKTANIA